MTKDEIFEANELLLALDDLVRVNTHLVAKPSAALWAIAGKMDKQDRSVEGDDSCVLSNTAGRAALREALKVIQDRLSELGVQ